MHTRLVNVGMALIVFSLISYMVTMFFRISLYQRIGFSSTMLLLAGEVFTLVIGALLAIVFVWVAYFKQRKERRMHAQEGK